MKNQIKFVKSRIGKLNEIIDKRIISGKEYSKQSKEHKDLLYYLKDLTAKD